VTTLVPKAEAYMAAYDKATKYQASWKKEMAEGRGAVAALLKTMQAWLPLFKWDIPGFDGGIYGDKPEVADDVIEDGERLASVVDEYRDGAGKPLPYQKAALDALVPAVQAAIKEWSEAEEADKQYQLSLAAVGQMADPLQQDLVALRRTMMAVAGRQASS
jgi:hypothetical protein